SAHMVSRRQSPFVFALALGALAAGALVPRNAAAQAPGPAAEPPAQAGSAGSQPSSGSTGASGENLIPQESTTGSTGAQPGSTPAVDPASDQAKLLKQGTERPTNDGTVGARPSEVYSEDW
ncbi:hypothetical protein HWN77_27940, partial [Escherichia coli]|uniref:hypothetical protein n=1 Tax=Escherichia coli TaxID=562 RepID=UPI0018556F81